ncbi:MAG: biotin--[acetyl-CoA-carboxylase] ligase [Actinomycetota bacterium]
MSQSEDFAAAFEAALTTKVLGHPVRHFPFSVTAESLALQWARQEKVNEGACVVVDREMAPRQRKGAPWTGFATDALSCSVVLRPGVPPEGEGLMWMLACLGGASGIENATGIETQIKWPDDILAGGRKIGGVKVDALLGPGEIMIAVMTFRINLNVDEQAFPEALRDVATSVLLETGKAMSREEALDGVLGGLEHWYGQDVPDLLEAYRSRCETVGRQVRARLLPKGEVMGKVSAVSDFGTLLVDVGGRPTPVGIDQLRKLEYT